MKQAVLALVLGVTLAGCSSGGAEDTPQAPSARPTVATTTAPPVQRPTSGATVPIGAFLSVADLGPSWKATPALATPCAPSYSRTATRSIGLAEPRGTLTETLATGVDLTTAVSAWRQSLQRCGYDVRDEALGDASLSARSKDRSDTVVVTGTEGVLVVLHARGALARASDDLDSWADLALGTSCVAAADGCH